MPRTMSLANTRMRHHGQTIVRIIDLKKFFVCLHRKAPAHTSARDCLRNDAEGILRSNKKVSVFLKELSTVNMDDFNL